MSDEDFVRWARSATRGVKESAAFINLWNDKIRDDPFDDPAPILQMGYCLFLDKPIIVIAPRGTKIPEHLRRCADSIQFYDREDEESVAEATRTALREIGMVKDP